MNGSRVLVTGGAGFLGAGLVHRLVEEGARVRVLDDASRGSFDRLLLVQDQVEVVSGDVRDAALVRDACEGVDTLYHLAAVNGTKNFYAHPERVLDVAIRGTLATVDAARLAGVRRYLLASTSEVYNEPPVVPTPEDVPLVVPDAYNPRFSYGGGKLAAELIAIHSLSASAPECVIFRPHNIYGPAMGFEHVIPNLVQRIRGQVGGGAPLAGLPGVEVLQRARQVSPSKRPEIELEIQGSGEETRAFCHVDDAVEGMRILALRGEHRRTYHLGRSVESSIRELAEEIGALLGVRIRLRPGVSPRGGPLRRCPDVRRMAALGFEAKISLREGLQRTIPFYWDHPGPGEDA